MSVQKTRPAAVFDASLRRRVLGRGLLLQSCWNFERMQNLGLCWALEPWLDSLYADGEARRKAALRHQEFFNTNPYFEPVIAGMICALEEEAAEAPAGKGEEALARLAALKKALASSLAAIGDTLFWQTLRPLAAASALLPGFWLWKAGAPWALSAMALVYLAVFNVPAQGLRWVGLRLGYDCREQIVSRLKSFSWQPWIRRLRLAGTALTLLLVGSALAAAGGPARRVAGVLAFLVCLIADRLAARPVSALKLYAGAGLLGTLAAAAGWL